MQILIVSRQPLLNPTLRNHGAEKKYWFGSRKSQTSREKRENVVTAWIAFSLLSSYIA